MKIFSLMILSGKTQSASCLLTEAPGSASVEQLDELNISIDIEEEM